MSLRFTLCLAALASAAAGCVHDVSLADRRAADAGVTAATDAPPFDAAPDVVCAACGGIDSASCLYAPGCGSVRRICADNTCGDAVAIDFCGCDGRTFVTGCLTPAQPWAFRGVCGDSGTIPDDIVYTPPDVPTDVAVAYCPEEVDHNTAVDPDLRYRRAAFAVPPDRSTRFEPGAVVTATGTWAGFRTLAEPMILGCPAGDARYGCRADVVLSVITSDSVLREFVVVSNPEEFRAFTVGMPVALRATATQWDGATPLRYAGSLTLRRPSDDALLYALVTSADDAALGVPFARATLVCTSRPEPTCRRVLSSYALRFSSGTQSFELSPGQAGLWITPSGTFIARNYVAYRRTPGGGAECEDLTAPVTSIELVRQPDL